MRGSGNDQKNTSSGSPGGGRRDTAPAEAVPPHEARVQADAGRSLVGTPRKYWSIQRMIYLALAAAFFLRFWPLQMHHWLGEAYMNEGMQVKGRIDSCMARGFASWPGSDEYKGQTVDELYESVYAAFDKSVRFYPFYMETYYIVGRYYIDGGGYSSEELDGLEEHLRRSRTTLSEKELASLMDLRMELLEKSEERLQQGREVLLLDIAMNPNYKWAHNNLGVIYDKLAQVASKKGEHYLVSLYRDFARSHYLTALDIDRDQIFALFNLGNGYLREGLTLQRMGQVEEASPLLAKAKHFMERSIEVQPDKKDSYDLLSQVLLMEKDYVGLVKCLEGYFGMMSKKNQRPVEDFYYRTLASAYLKAEDPIPPNPAARPKGGTEPLTNAERGARARDLLLEARLMRKAVGGKTGAELARMLADAYILLGDYQKAQEEYKGVLEGGIDDPIVYLDLARLSVGARRLVEARDYVRRALLDQQQRERIHRLITSDPVLEVITLTPWYEDLCSELGLEAPRSATDEISSVTPPSP
jgi:tetratricopeptide (TPR) repeat protein